MSAKIRKSASSDEKKSAVILLTIDEIKQIVAGCIEKLYGGDKADLRTQKNRAPNMKKMTETVMKHDVTIVGLFKYLSEDMRKMIAYKSNMKTLKTDHKIQQELAKFILSYDNDYTSDYCCFMTDTARNALQAVADGESTRFPLNFRTWFYVSERQLHGYNGEKN